MVIYSANSLFEKPSLIVQQHDLENNLYFTQKQGPLGLAVANTFTYEEHTTILSLLILYSFWFLWIIENLSCMHENKILK